MSAELKGKKVLVRRQVRKMSKWFYKEEEKNRDVKMVLQGRGEE